MTSSLSQVRILEDVAIRSAAGKFCAPGEARTCFWSGRKSHPNDLRSCALTGLPIHFEFATTDGAPRLRPLAEILDGIRRSTDETQLWDAASARIAAAPKAGRCRVESATLSPTKKHLATCSEVKTLLGLRIRHVGAVYDIAENSVIGRLAVGKRGANSWIELRR